MKKGTNRYWKGSGASLSMKFKQPVFRATGNRLMGTSSTRYSITELWVICFTFYIKMLMQVQFNGLYSPTNIK